MEIKKLEELKNEGILQDALDTEAQLRYFGEIDLNNLVDHYDGTR